MQITNLLGSLYVKPLPFNAPTGRSLVDNVTTKVAADASSFADSLTTAAAASTATTSIATTPTPPDASASSSDKSKNDQATQDFLDYMKETPAQRLEDAWLASHHLTRKQLEAMSPDQRKAIEKQMETEIEAQIKQAAQSRPKTDIVV
jgi:hypothetical protein